MMFPLSVFNVKRRQILLSPRRKTFSIWKELFKNKFRIPDLHFRNSWLSRNITTLLWLAEFVNPSPAIIRYSRAQNLPPFPCISLTKNSYCSTVRSFLLHPSTRHVFDPIEIWYLVQPFISCSLLDINLPRIHQTRDIIHHSRVRTRNASRACRDFASGLQWRMDACKPSPVTHG